mmetsp:Transcript_85147/g.237651  ORF Transcript_85147/g.237651 Transcript_85147/m.237651 type:complete len:316 (+) Transcript_85147:2607-3554(+)
MQSPAVRGAPRSRLRGFHAVVHGRPVLSELGDPACGRRRSRKPQAGAHGYADDVDQVCRPGRQSAGAFPARIDARRTARVWEDNARAGRCLRNEGTSAIPDGEGSRTPLEVHWRLGGRRPPGLRARGSGGACRYFLRRDRGLGAEARRRLDGRHRQGREPDVMLLGRRGGPWARLCHCCHRPSGLGRRCAHAARALRQDLLLRSAFRLRKVTDLRDPRGQTWSQRRKLWGPSSCGVPAAAQKARRTGSPALHVRRFDRALCLSKDRGRQRGGACPEHRPRRGFGERYRRYPEGARGHVLAPPRGVSLGQGVRVGV